MSQETMKAPTPVCIVLSNIPFKELQGLKADLANAWDSVVAEAPIFKDFHFLPWSGILGPNYTLRQIHHLVKQASIETGWSTCLILDAMSGLSKVAYLAQYDENDELGSSVRIGTIPLLRDAPRCLMDLENGLESSKVHSWIYVRDPEMPITGGQQRSHAVSKRPDPQFTHFKVGGGTMSTILPILCTAEMEEDSFDRFKAKLNQIHDMYSPAWALIAWRHTSKASRAAMYNAATQGLQGDNDNEQRYRYLIFLDAQTMTDNSMLLGRYVNLDDTGGNNPLRRRLILGRIPFDTLPSFFEQYIEKPQALIFFDDFMEQGAYEELIWNPDCPLSVRKPLYLHQGCYPDTPTFFLANLSEEDEANIKKELETPCNYDGSENADKKFTYVPWTGTEDLAAMKLETCIPQYMSYLTESSGDSVAEAIFIDFLSPLDHRVTIATAKRDISDPTEYAADKEKLMTIYWGRVELQQAQSLCTNLSISNLSYDDVFGDHVSEVTVSKRDRRQLAEMGKPLAEAGLWDYS